MTTIKNKQFNRGRFALLANENENENEQVEEENLNNLILNNYKKTKNINCNTNLKRKHHPQCARNNSNKKERIKKIKNFWEEYNQEINPLEYSEGVEPKVRRVSNSFLNKFVFNKTQQFLNQKNTQENRWMFNSFNYWRDIVEPNRLKIKNLEPNNLTTRRQKLFRDMSGDERLIYIQQLFLPENWESNRGIHSIQSEVIELFRETNIANKIQFNYDFERPKNSQNNNYFIFKIHNLKRNPIILSIIPSYTTQQNKLNKITTELLKGEKSLKKIFGEELFNELNRIGILDDKSIDIYNKQYVRRNRDSAYAKLKIWVKTFFEKIEILEKILNLLDKNLLTKENVDKIFVDSILNVLGLYLFTCNYILREHFEERNKLLEWAYEGLYYNYMGIYFNFINNFLNCNDEGIKNNFEKTPFNEGFVGKVYKSDNLKFILKEQKEEPEKTIHRFERTFFEFFKQLCLYKNNKLHFLEEIYFPEPHLFIFGNRKIFVKMEFVQGDTLIMYFYKKFTFINNKNNINNNNKNNLKKNIVYNFLIQISDIIKKLQNQLNFVHGDLNVKNVLISSDNSNSKINIKLIDFDVSILKYNNLYIFNFFKFLDLNELFDKKNKNNLSDFSKSIDLLRMMNYFCYLGEFINLLIIKNKNIHNIKKKYGLEDKVVELINKIYFNSYNGNFPDILENYFKKKELKKYDKYFKIVFTNLSYIRRKIWLLFYNDNKNKLNTNKILELNKNKMWIHNFIPENFIYNLNKVFLE